jgi:N4-gp56 family major capsid protein
MPFYEQAPQGTQFTNITSSVFIPEIWKRDIIRRRDDSLVMKGCISMIDFRGEKGDTIYIPYVSDMAVNSKVQGYPVTYQSYSDRRWQMVVNRYKEVSFAIDKLLEIQSSHDLRSIYTERAGFALARDIEHAILAERATINGYNSASNVITSGAPLDYTDILAASEILDNLNIPREGRKLIISPSQHASLLTQPEFINADYSSEKRVETGRVGSCLGIPIMMTSSLKVNSTSGFVNGEGATGSPTAGMSGSLYYPTQSPALRDGTSVTASALTAGYHTAMLIHPDWAKLAMVKSPNVDYDWSVDYQEHHIVLTQIYDVECYRPDHAVLINTTES